MNHDNDRVSRLAHALNRMEERSSDSVDWAGDQARRILDAMGAPEGWDPRPQPLPFDLAGLVEDLRDSAGSGAAQQVEESVGAILAAGQTMASILEGRTSLTDDEQEALGAWQDLVAP